MSSVGIPYLSNGDWPLMFLAMDGAILAFLAIRVILTACGGISAVEKKVAEQALPTCSAFEVGTRIIAAGGLIRSRPVSNAPATHPLV